MHIALYFHCFSSQVPPSLRPFLIYLSKSFFSIHISFKCMILCIMVWLVCFHSRWWCIGTIYCWRTCSLRFQMSRSDVWFLIYPDYSLLLYSILFICCDLVSFVSTHDHDVFIWVQFVAGGLVPWGFKWAGVRLILICSFILTTHWCCIKCCLYDDLIDIFHCSLWWWLNSLNDLRFYL